MEHSGDGDIIWFWWDMVGMVLTTEKSLLEGSSRVRSIAGQPWATSARGTALYEGGRFESS
jgi:hypothetical protein